MKSVFLGLISLNVRDQVAGAHKTLIIKRDEMDPREGLLSEGSVISGKFYVHEPASGIRVYMQLLANIYANTHVCKPKRNLYACRMKYSK